MSGPSPADPTRTLTDNRPHTTAPQSPEVPGTQVGPDAPAPAGFGNTTLPDASALPEVPGSRAGAELNRALVDERRPHGPQAGQSRRGVPDQSLPVPDTVRCQRPGQGRRRARTCS